MHSPGFGQKERNALSKQRKKAHRHSFHTRSTIRMTCLVIVPVLIVATVNFFILYSTNVRSLENDLRLRSEQTLEILNTNLGSMQKLVSQRRMDTTFSNEAQQKVGTAYFPIIQQLQEDSIWTTFFSSVRFYNRESGLVYELNRALTEDDCFGKPEKTNNAHYRTDALELQPWDRRSFEEEGNNIRVMRVRHADGDDNGVMFAVPFEYVSDEAPVSYMLFIVSDGTFDSQFSSLEGATCVLYYQDTPFYSTDPEICEQIYEGRDVPGDLLGSQLLSFESGGMQIDWQISIGFQMRRIIPTIVLQSAVTFIVMAVSLALLLYISRKTYQPIQNLLSRLPPRPETEGAVDEFKYISFMLDDYDYSRRFYEESVQELRREKYLFYILDNQVEPGKALYQQCLHAGIRVDRRYFACVLMEDTEKNYELFDRITSEKAFAKEPIDAYSLYIMGNKYLFLFASDLSRQAFADRLAELTGGDSELVRVSEPIEGVQNVRLAYTAVCWPEKFGAYPVVEFQLLQEAVETSNLDKAEFALRMIKSDIGSYTQETRMAVLRSVRALMSEIPGAQPEPADQSEDESSQVLDEMLHRLASGEESAPEAPPETEKTQPRNLHTIMRYIEEHYTDPNFSIKYMACVFGTSPSNLSHQFKKLTGRTLSSFIDELRISKAEELLDAGEKINVVAQKLGYSTTPVFTETYKRVRGMTPSSYKSQSQQSK